MKKLLLFALTALSFAITATAQQFHWAKTGQNYRHVATDKVGNVYMIGFVTGGGGPVDVDPGPGVANISATQIIYKHSYVLKLNKFGDFVWAFDLNYEGYLEDLRLAVDNSQNVYAVGSQTIDMFDPGNVGFIKKIKPNGILDWDFQYGTQSGTPYCKVNDVAVDSLGNVYVTGDGTASDLDPGPNTVPSLASAFIVKYTPTGDYVWQKNSSAFRIEVSADGNSIYTVEYSPWMPSVIRKRNATGDAIWGRTIDSVIFNDLNVTEAGKIYATGQFTDTVDMDPGAGVTEFETAGGADQFLLKLDTAGIFIWAKQLGSTSIDVGTAVVMDGKGHIYTTGTFSGTVDMDPGVAVNNLVSITSDTPDIFVQKLDTAGNYIWAKPIGTNWFETSYGLAIDTAGAIFIVGYATGADLNPGTPVFTLPLSSSFVTKWSDTIVVNSARTVLNAEDNIILYPNPSNKTINVSAEQVIDNISVSDISGRVIFNSTPANKRTSVEISTPGIYFITVTTGDKVSRGKVLIQ